VAVLQLFSSFHRDALRVSRRLNFRRCSSIGLVALYLLLCGCSRTPELVKLQGKAQGTHYNITYWAAQPSLQPEALQAQVDARLQQIDASLSNYRADSAIEVFNQLRSTEPQAVPAELLALVDMARPIAEASQGCYDLTIKPLFELWGFKKAAFQRPSDADIQRLRASIGMEKLQRLPDGRLQKALPEITIDVSSIGQGYSVGEMANLLERAGITDYLVELGGEMQLRGKKPGGESWRVAIEKPLAGQQQWQKILALKAPGSLAIMTSGTYRHYFDVEGTRYSHILDARTGKPVQHNTLSVTVFHQNPSLADAWSTALLCLGTQEGLPLANRSGLSALFIEDVSGQLQERASDALKNTTWLEFTQSP
jgi:FAD:protein FMN transferase